jgi:ubiquitin-conjugating enzyme (huntingtin interacting protein 2)
VQVQRLTKMGFPEDLVRSTLMSVNGDENLALERPILAWWKPY